MQSQISRILTSNLNLQLIQSLQSNQQQIGQLQQLLAVKNSQVLQLHHKIDTEMQGLVLENERLRQGYAHMGGQLEELRRGLGGVQAGVREEGRMLVAAVGQVWAAVQEIVRENGVLKSQLEEQKAANNRLANQVPSRLQCNMRNSNAHLIERLQKSEQQVLTLKQQKFQLEKQLSKYRQLLQQSQACPSPQQCYTSTQSLSETDRRTLICTHFHNNFAQLQQTKYCGSMIGSLKNGQGECHYMEGFVYRGAFVQGRRQGLGEMSCEGEVVYRGWWQADKPSGKGNLYYLREQNVVSYQGFFKDGRMHGYGTLELRDGAKLRCQFNEGKPIGPYLMESSEMGEYRYSQAETDQHELRSLIY